jgi:polysaccharide deacetylase family protein (PEP-CTERM system associated)
MQPQSRSGQKHILTIALEDYFHGPAFSKIISNKRWSRFETRLEKNCSAVLEKLDSVGSQATFFVTSWVAQNCPDLLTEIVKRGHEIALAGNRGFSFRRLNPAELREQIKRDRSILELACGRSVVGFRASDTLLDPSDLWALEILASENFKYDSSVSPLLRTFSREPWRRFIHENHFDCGSLWEIPLSSALVGGLMIPIAGGNYFRQFPEWLISRSLQRWTLSCEQPLVLYFRLWDFDPDQPRIHTGSVWMDFRHYRNSDRILLTLDRVLHQFSFTSIADHLQIPTLALEPASRDVASAQMTVERRTKNLATPISIIVPCFNEQAGITYLARNLDELKSELHHDYDVEFILVDDGSRDDTWNVLQRTFSARQDTRLLRHSQNQGVSAAIMTGLQEAREIACSIDCDCSYDPTLLKPMLMKMIEGVDLVTASPYHPDGAVLNVPKWRLLLSRCSSLLYRVVTGQKLYTFTACMRVYRRSTVLTLAVESPGFLGVAELLSRLVLNGKKVVEHPATLEVRIFGQSKMKVLRTISGHLKLLSHLTVLRWKGEKRVTSSDSAVNSQASTSAAVVTEVEL